ncbi:branched-chain amino acid transporter AzlC [Leuconostoc litchii]|uniref:Branched-chain amino acid ABC transporter permease n=1 Tax=Leuconostoc litchii TaxID=1981069 RepID=A0A6P2CS59_9LACO|nr:AzlC family ABC transporter permease [Leuconostoc litchii]TYC47117.1 branched-chain amino acid ABC transporter permease [Leuconostoc litchii]GMA69070.1 branched-chain amino acid transporter AzlC [Leuconostoc litchii]
MFLSNQQLTDFWDGVKSSLPTMLGYISIGAAFGTIAGAQHFTAWQVFLLGGVLYAGSAQFIVVSMLVTQSSISNIILMVFLVNFRMFLQSLTVTRVFPNQSTLSSLLMGSLVTDESFGILSVNIAADKQRSVMWMHGLNISSWLTWWLSCVIFSVVGKGITNPAAYGLDFALPAMFAGLWLLTSISMFQNPKEDKLKIWSIIIVSIILLYLLMCFFSGAVAVLVASITASLYGVLIHQRSKKLR